MADVHGNVIHEALARVDAHERRPVKTAMRNNCFVMCFLFFVFSIFLFCNWGPPQRVSEYCFLFFLFFQVFWLEMTQNMEANFRLRYKIYVIIHLVEVYLKSEYKYIYFTGICNVLE